MLPVFTVPLAFLGLLAIPTLTAIYWLRNRFRRYPVSSLLLWLDQTEVREGGTRRHRLHTPLLFYLELLAILLLVLAAAGPYVQTSPGTRPLVVVLDDSYSMLAGGDGSPRQLAVAAIREELRARSCLSIRFILAGEKPQLLGDAVHAPAEATDLLAEWHCRAPSSHLEEAMALASELGGDRGLTLVVTDHPPDPVPGKGRVQWWAFGSPRPNVAFVNAARTAREKSERCLLEIANLAPQAQTTTLVVEAGDPPLELQRSTLSLEPRENRRVVLDLKEGMPAVRATLSRDDLEIDNHVILQPSVPRPIQVATRIRDGELRSLVEKGIRATPAILGVTPLPDLWITDRDDPGDDRDAWLVRLLVEKDAEAFTGPFVMDRAHPLTQGLSLQGVLWAAGKSEELPGAPIITAGNIPLLTDMASPTGRHEVRLRLRPELSTLPTSPNWPILMWNLVQWRAVHLPGLSRTNLRLGEETVLTLAAARDTVALTDPNGTTRAVPTQGRQVTVKADEVGVYELHVDEDCFRFAANTLNQEESDLTASGSGRWGDWLDDTALRLEYQSVAWLLVLLVLAILGLHLYLVARTAGRISG